jgi:hypothetical protein
MDGYDGSQERENPFDLTTRRAKQI